MAICVMMDLDNFVGGEIFCSYIRIALWAVGVWDERAFSHRFVVISIAINIEKYDKKKV